MATARNTEKQRPVIIILRDLEHMTYHCVIAKTPWYLSSILSSRYQYCQSHDIPWYIIAVKNTVRWCTYHKYWPITWAHNDMQKAAGWAGVWW